MKVFPPRFLTLFGLAKYLLFSLSIVINIEYMLFGTLLKCQPRRDSTKYHSRSKRVEKCLASRELEGILEAYVSDLIAFKLSFSSDVDTALIDKHFKDIQRIRENISSIEFSSASDDNGQHVVVVNSPYRKNKMVAKATQRKQTNNVSKDEVNNSNNNPIVYSCPEKFLGALYGYPLYRIGFVHKQPCSHIPTNISTSLILDRPRLFGSGVLEKSTSIFTKEILKFVAGIFKEVNIIINAKYLGNLKDLITAWPNIFVHVFQHTTPDVSELLNSICKKLKTKLVVFAPFVTAMNGQFNLNRLLHVYERTGANIVASSVKDFATGVWETGCYQTSLKFYSLEYRQGYRRSRFSCLKCDFVKGPFLTITDLFRKGLVRFRGESGSMLYEDLFLNLGLSKNKTILACPDSMVYTYQGSYSKYDDASELEKLVKLWDVYKVKLHSNTALKNFIFPCPHSRNQLIRTCRVGRGLAVPPCCLKLLYNGLKFVSRLFESHKIQYMLIEGSALSAVKFNSLLPWEQDADIAISSNDFHRLDEKMKLEFEKNNYTLVIDEGAKCCRPPPARVNQSFGGVAHARVFHWSIQIFGFDSLTNLLDNNNNTFGSPNTKIKLIDADSDPSSTGDVGFFAYVPENPAQYSRNRYGHEVFKHAEHWMKARHKNGWEDYKSGKFEECSKPHHHACLDQFEPDGYLRD